MIDACDGSSSIVVAIDLLSEGDAHCSALDRDSYNIAWRYNRDGSML